MFKTDTDEKKLLNKVIILVFFAHKIYPFWVLNVSVAVISMQGQKSLRSPHKYLNLMNKGLTGLEQHDSSMTEFSFLGELYL